MVARQGRPTKTLPRPDLRAEYCSRPPSSKLTTNLHGDARTPPAISDREDCVRSREDRGDNPAPTSGSLETDLVRAIPENALAEFWKALEIRCQRDEMVARKLAHLAGEMHPAIGQQNFGFADAPG